MRINVLRPMLHRMRILVEFRESSHISTRFKFLEQQSLYRNNSTSSFMDNNRRRPLNQSLVDLLNDSTSKGKYTDPLQRQMDLLTHQTQLFLPRFTSDYPTQETTLSDENELRSSCLTLMKDWFQLQCDIAQSTTLSTRQRMTFRRRRDIPPTSSPHYTLITCAENIHTLLHHYISLFKRMKPKDSSILQDTTLPFQLAMKAWNQTSSHHSKFCYPVSGDYCASILDQWGSLFGGDLNHAPTTEAFNLVLETYAFCSSGPYDYQLSTPVSSSTIILKDATTASSTPSFPAVQAYDIFQILHQDFVLRPTIESYCHVITALKNHAFALHYSRNPNDNIHKQGSSFMNSYTAASLAFQTFTLLEELLIKTKVDWKGKRTQSDQPLELLVLEAFTHILAFISRGFLSDKDVHTASSTKAVFKNNGEQAENVLDRLLGFMSTIRMNQQDADASLPRLSEYVGDAYLSCMIAWTHNPDQKHSGSDKVQAADSIMKLVHHLQAFANQHQWDDTLPHSSHYYTVLNAYAQCFENVPLWSESDTKNIMALQPHRKCWKIVEQMEERAYNNSFQVNEPVDLQLIYCRIISILSQCIRFNLCPNDIMMVVNNAETALTTLIHKYQSGAIRVYDPQDITRAFNHVMLIHSHPSLYKLTENKISKLFSELIQLSKDHSRNPPKPDAYTYSLYMSQLSQSISNYSVQKMVMVLNDIEKQYETGSSQVRPNVAHYSTVMKLLGKVGGKKNSIALMDIFRRAEEKLSQPAMGRFDDDKYLSPVILYSSYVSALSESGFPSCGDEALKTLRKLKQRYQETRDDKFQPDIIMYSVVLDAISKSKDVDRTLILEAQAIVDEIETMYNDGNRIIPNRIIYTSAMKTWSKSGLEEAPEKCIEIIQRMIKMFDETGREDISPDIVSYSVALDSISRSANPGSMDTALMLLNDMEDRAKKGASYLKPNAIVYTKVINAIWKSGHDDAGGLAEKILDKMEERCHEGDFTTNPDSYAYTSVINCWGRSRRSDKVQRAWNVVLRMKENYEKGNLGAKPNVVAITSFLNCCAHTHSPNDEKAKSEAILLATTAFQLLMSNPQFGTANSTTYRTLLEVFGRNVKDVKTRNNHSSKVFQLSADGGMVDDYVLANLKRYTLDLYNQLPSTLPKSWSRNVS